MKKPVAPILATLMALSMWSIPLMAEDVVKSEGEIKGEYTLAIARVKESEDRLQSLQQQAKNHKKAGNRGKLKLTEAEVKNAAIDLKKAKEEAALPIALYEKIDLPRREAARSVGIAEDKLASLKADKDRHLRLRRAKQAAELDDDIAQAQAEIASAKARLVEVKKPVKVVVPEVALLEAKKGEATTPQAIASTMTVLEESAAVPVVAVAPAPTRAPATMAPAEIPSIVENEAAIASAVKEVLASTPTESGGSNPHDTDSPRSGEGPDSRKTPSAPAVAKKDLPPPTSVKFRISNPHDFRKGGGRSSGTVEQGPVGRGGKVSKAKVLKPAKAATVRCNDQDYIPMAMLNELMNPEHVEISGNLATSEKDKYATLKVPSFISNCLDLDADYVEKEGKLFVFFKNKFDLSAYEGRNVSEKYAACLAQQGILDEEGSFKAPEDIEDKVDLASVSINMPIDNFNPKNSLKVIVGSPKDVGSDYGPAYGARFMKIPNEPDSCKLYEEIHPIEDGRYAYQKEDAKKARYQELCETGTIEEVEYALKNITGEGEAVKVIKAALASVLNKLAEEKVVAAEKRMVELSKEIKTLKIAEEGEDLVREYVDQLRTVDKYGLTPNIAKLQKLSEELKKVKGKSKDAERKLADEIKELTREIAKYDKLDKFLSRDMLARVAEIGMKESADEIADFKYRSKHYGLMGPKLDKSSLQLAEKRIESDVKKFKQYSAEQSSIYNTKMGIETGNSRRYSKQTQRLAAAREKAWQTYQQNTYKAMQACQTNMLGQVSNAYKCQQAQKNQRANLQKALKTREAYNSKISSVAQKAEYFSTLEAIAQRKREQEVDETDFERQFGFDYGDSFTSDFSMDVDDNFGFDYGMDMSGRMPSSGYQMQPQGMQNVPFGQTGGQGNFFMGN